MLASLLLYLFFLVVVNSVAGAHRFDADLGPDQDPDCNFDLYPACYFDAVPISVQIGSYSIHFGLLLQIDADPDPAYLFNFDAHPDPDPDPAYHCDAVADPDSTFQFDADRCGSGSTTLFF